MKEKIQQLSEKYFARVVALRREIHAHPELSHHEFNTAKLVATELNKLGLEVQTEIAGTGVLAMLRGKNPESKCIALRADMDALPITEENNCDYKSQKDGVMHACGHDVHTANLLGVAMVLSELKDKIEGTIKFIFQPAEEKIPSGAEAMIAAGVLKNPKPSKIFGWHVHPEMEAGEVGFCSGKFMASADEIYLTVIGKGGHAAQPQNFVSPLLIASEILMALKKFTDLSTPTVLSFGRIEGNGATNVIPEQVTLQGTLRCFDESIRQAIHEEMTSICETIALGAGGKCEVSILKGSPVLFNDEALTAQSKEAAQDYLTLEKVYDLPIRMGAEDFAFYTHLVPACFYRIGVGNKAKGITVPIHSASFDIDENALKTSVGLMSWLAYKA